MLPYIQGLRIPRTFAFPFRSLTLPRCHQRSNCLIKHASHSCLAGLSFNHRAASMASPYNSLHGATDSPSKQPASYACVVCHNRKVKCDKQDHRTPCSNCAKANVECIYRAPPPRRKRNRETNGSVSQERAKHLRRSTGFDQNPPARQHHHHAAGDQRTEPEKSGSGRMIVKDGNSIYLDK